MNFCPKNQGERGKRKKKGRSGPRSMRVLPGRKGDRNHSQAPKVGVKKGGKKRGRGTAPPGSRAAVPPQKQGKKREGNERISRAGTGGGRGGGKGKKKKKGEKCHTRHRPVFAPFRTKGSRKKEKK